MADRRHGDGAMAQWCLAADSAVLPLPDGVADDLAAALGLSAIAAWMALTWRGGLQPGEHVLVLGASGTVGQVTVQAARLLGAGRVIAACRDAHGRARAAGLGADAVADLSGTDAGVIAEHLAVAVAGRADLVVDPLWGAPAEAAMAALGGVIDASTVLSAQASNGGTALTFTVLAGIVVGGTSILGGEGAIWRSVVGVLFIALIDNGSDLLGLNPLYDQIALGGILLIAVGGDAWSRVRTG